LAMESIMEQIRTRLQGGETPQELIKGGFKRTTVYSVAKKMEGKFEESNNDKSMDRDVFLTCLIREVLAYTSDDDPDELLKSCIEIAGDNFQQLLGREPPKDFLTSTLRTPE